MPHLAQPSMPLASEPERPDQWLQAVERLSGRERMEYMAASLPLAMRRQWPPAVQMTLEQVDVQILADPARDLLVPALWYGHTNVVRILMSDQRYSSQLLTAIDEDGNTPLQLAVRQDNLEAFKCLSQLERVPSSLRSPGPQWVSLFHLACRSSSLSIVGLMLREDRQYNTKTALELCKCEGQSALHAALESGSDDMVMLLLQHWSISQLMLPDAEGRLPLFRAIRWHRVTLMASMLGSCSNVRTNLQQLTHADNHGECALDHARRTSPQLASMIEHHMKQLALPVPKLESSAALQ